MLKERLQEKLDRLYLMEKTKLEINAISLEINETIDEIVALERQEELSQNPIVPEQKKPEIKKTIEKKPGNGQILHTKLKVIVQDILEEYGEISGSELSRILKETYDLYWPSGIDRVMSNLRGRHSFEYIKERRDGINYFRLPDKDDE